EAVSRHRGVRYVRSGRRRFGGRLFPPGRRGVRRLRSTGAAGPRRLRPLAARAGARDRRFCGELARRALRAYLTAAAGTPDPTTYRMLDRAEAQADSSSKRRVMAE